MWIGGSPYFRLTGGQRSRGQPMPFPRGNNCVFFFSARYALYHGLAALGLGRGDAVLVPAYCCGTEIDPFIARGIDLVWYDVDENLRIDVGKLRERLQKNVKAILVTHYIGFDILTDELVDLCRDRGLLLIEDCAHAFLGASPAGQPLGSRGDAAVFSFRKFLPIPDGGALVLNEPYTTAAIPALGEPNPCAVHLRSAELLANNTLLTESRRHRLAWRASRQFGRTVAACRIPLCVLFKTTGSFRSLTVQPNTYDFAPEAVHWSISSFSRKRLSNQDWNGIFEKRRSNYSYLLERIERSDDVRPLVPRLPDGACPLFFPVMTPRRDRLHAALLRSGVDSHPWWGYFHGAVPWDSHPMAVMLKKNLLGLPIHQDLDRQHMDRILWALDAAMR